MKNLAIVLSVLCLAMTGTLHAAEPHVARVVGEILSNAAKLRAADPSAVPMAFWDFDGTILRGDVSEGLVEDGAVRYQGLAEAGIRAGFSAIYRGEEGWRQFRDRDYPRLNEIGRFLAWPYLAQMFAGTRLADLEAFCTKRFETVYRPWYFASSLEILRRLEAAGVENHVISASPEIFVACAAGSLGLDRSRLNAIRVGIDGGVVTTRIEHPVPFGEGKVEVLRRIVNARPHGYALAGFGNSYGTDGAFLRYVVSQRNLPGDARGFALMINGSGRRPEYEGLFTCVAQEETVGRMPRE